jgi:hypothetical protein
MDFLYDNVRNERHGLSSERLMENGRPVYVLRLVNLQLNRVDQEKKFYAWDQYSSFYQKMLVMLQNAPP